MKAKAIMKVLLLLCVLKTFTASSQTNIYQPFPVSNTIWIGIYLAGTTDQTYDDYNLYISGDTTIGPYTYHKLYRNGCVTTWPPQGGPHYYYGGYAGAFRQNTANKKVYLYKNGVDSLAYDFNLNVGDTLPPSCLIRSYQKLYIKSIDSVIVNNQYRKRFWMYFVYSNGPGYELVEGIGSRFGAFEMMDYPFEGSRDLYCVRMNAKVVWTRSTGGYSCGLTSISDNVTSENSVILSQNPFSTVTTLTLTTNVQNATQVIYDSSGKLVRQITTISGNTISIHRDNLPSGIYFFQLSENNKIIATQKLVIIDN